MSPTVTPWGVPTHVTERGPGVWFVSTPSHGGFVLASHNTALVPAAWRAATFDGQGERGYYEEDCDACMVPLAFPHLFTSEELGRAARMFRAAFPALLVPGEAVP